jgi:hypothetical protein
MTGAGGWVCANTPHEEIRNVEIQKREIKQRQVICRFCIKQA